MSLYSVHVTIDRRFLTACLFRVADVVHADLAVISSLRSLARYRARAYLSPVASNTLLVPSRLAFLQRSASGTAGLRLS